jgi:hypothetical protein
VGRLDDRVEQCVADLVGMDLATPQEQNMRAVDRIGAVTAMRSSSSAARRRSRHSIIRRELQPAFELAQQLVSLAESVQDSGLLVEAHLAQGNSLFLFGKLIPALEHRSGRSLSTTLRHITFMHFSMG